MTEKETIKRPEITKEWLNENGACSDGTSWFNGQNETAAKTVLLELLKQDHFDWANWTIVRLMTHEQKIKYAIYSAEKVLSIYEEKYPENKAPHNAIKAAKACLKNPSEGNRAAAYAAANAAYAAADAADAMKKQIIEYGIKLIGASK
jgi:ribosomal protein S20